MVYRFLYLNFLLFMGCFSITMFGQTIISAGAYSAEDVTSPSITISAAEGLSGFSSLDTSIALTFTVSESTYNFVVGDVTVSNGYISNFSGTGSLFTATFTPTTDGATSTQVLSNTFSDGVGNANTASNTFTWTKTTEATDGLTSATASSSAYQIKQDYPSSTDGIYWISNASINGGTPFQIYADMTTDGGGWMLLNSSGGGSASSQSETVTSLGLRRYIPRTRVEILALDASSVMLASGPSNNKNQHTIISTDSRPISALRSSSTSREGAATFHYNSAYTSFTIYSGSTWYWSKSCTPGSDTTGWPTLYHACGNGNGVHYKPLNANAAGKDWNSGGWYSTWIR